MTDPRPRPAPGRRDGPSHGFGVEGDQVGLGDPPPAHEDDQIAGGLRPAPAMPRASAAGAAVPCTWAGTTTTVKAKPEPRSWPRKSLKPSVPGLATRPIRRGEIGHGQWAVAAEEALGLERLEQGGTARRQPTEEGVDVHVDGDEIDLGPRAVELDPAPEGDDRPDVEDDALPGQCRLHGCPRPLPAIDLQDLGVAPPRCVGIDQIDIAVAGAVGDALDLAAHPDQLPAWECPGDGRLHPVEQAGDRQDVRSLRREELSGPGLHVDTLSSR